LMHVITIFELTRSVLLFALPVLTKTGPFASISDERQMFVRKKRVLLKHSLHFEARGSQAMGPCITSFEKWNPASGDNVINAFKSYT